MVVTFLGHSKIPVDSKLEQWMEKTLLALIQEGADQFLLGGYGDFDNFAAKMVRKCKNTHPDIHSLLVIPYLGRDFNPNIYDNSVYPYLEEVPKRFAISKRNEWMVEEADVVVAYLINYAGGSGRTMEYAQRKKKKIIWYQEEQKKIEQEELANL